MANKVVVKRSSVPGKTPTTADLDLGEIAVNTYDGKIYIKKNVSGTESIVAFGGSVNLSGGGYGTAGDISTNVTSFNRILTSSDLSVQACLVRLDDNIPLAINDLNDVAITSPSSGHVLKYNGSSFVNEAVSYSDVSGTPTLASVATSGDYNDLTNKPSFSSTLDGLTDVVITTPSDNQILKYSGGQWINANNTGGSGIANVVDDTTPELGGDLQTNSNRIIGSGTVIIDGDGAGSGIVEVDGDFLVLGGTITAESGASIGDSTNTLKVGSAGITAVVTNSDVNIAGNGTGKVKIEAVKFPKTDGASNQVLKTDGSGNLSWTDMSGGSTTLDGLTDVVITTPSTDQILKYNGTNWVNSAASTGGSADPVDIFRYTMMFGGM